MVNYKNIGIGLVTGLIVGYFLFNSSYIIEKLPFALTSGADRMVLMIIVGIIGGVIGHLAKNKARKGKR